METEHLYVFAKNYREFRFFCNLNNINWTSSLIHYIPEGGQALRGTRRARVVYYGAYHDRKDYLEVAGMIREREMIDVTNQYKHS